LNVWDGGFAFLSHQTPPGGKYLYAQPEKKYYLDNFPRHTRTSTWLVSRSQTFRLTAEGLEFIAAFFGQGPPIRPLDRHVKQPITVRFVQRHVSGRGNVPTTTDRCATSQSAVTGGANNAPCY